MKRLANNGEMTPQTKGITRAPLGPRRDRDGMTDHDFLWADENFLDHCA